MEDPYEVLGVKKSASESVIDAVYRELVKENHPDNGGDPEVFKNVKQAYDEITSGDTSSERAPGWFDSLFYDTEPAETFSAVGDHGQGLTVEGDVFTVKLMGILPDIDASEIVQLPYELGENTSRTVVLFDIVNNTDDVQRWHRDKTKFIDKDGFTYERESKTIDRDKLGPRWTSFSVEVEPNARTYFVSMVEETPPEARLRKIVHTKHVFAEGRTSGWTQDAPERYEFVIDEADRTSIALPQN